MRRCCHHHAMQTVAVLHRQITPPYAEVTASPISPLVSQDVWMSMEIRWVNWSPPGLGEGVALIVYKKETHYHGLEKKSLKHFNNNSHFVLHKFGTNHSLSCWMTSSSVDVGQISWLLLPFYNAYYGINTHC